MMGKVFVIPLLVAEIVTVEAEATAETVAEKFAVDAPAAIVTLAGTVTEAELLESAMLSPPVGAAVVSVTVQASVPAAE